MSAIVARHFVFTIVGNARELLMTFTAVLLLAFLMGFVGGLRSLTAPAVICWAARLGWIHLEGSKLQFLGSAAAVAIFTLFAIVELVADQLPSAPARTAPPGLIARIVLGALCGAAIGVAGSQSIAMCAATGAVGGIAGAFGGYQARTRLVRALKVPDLVIALLEDLLAIGSAVFLMSRF